MAEELKYKINQRVPLERRQNLEQNHFQLLGLDEESHEEELAENHTSSSIQNQASDIPFRQTTKGHNYNSRKPQSPRSSPFQVKPINKLQRSNRQSTGSSRLRILSLPRKISAEDESKTRTPVQFGKLLNSGNPPSVSERENHTSATQSDTQSVSTRTKVHDIVSDAVTSIKSVPESSTFPKVCLPKITLDSIASCFIRSNMKKKSPNKSSKVPQEELQADVKTVTDGKNVTDGKTVTDAKTVTDTKTVTDAKSNLKEATPTISVSDFCENGSAAETDVPNTEPSTQGALHSDVSTRSQRRIRSPSGRYNDGMILYPWSSLKQRVSPRRTHEKEKSADKSDTSSVDLDKSSPSKKSGDEVDNSSSSSSVSRNSSCNTSPSSQKKCEASSSSSSSSSSSDESTVAREIHFDDSSKHTTSGQCNSGSPKPSTSSSEPIEFPARPTLKLLELSQLISKVSTSIEISEKDELSALFGHVEEPDEEESEEEEEEEEESENEKVSTKSEGESDHEGGNKDDPSFADKDDKDSDKAMEIDGEDTVNDCTDEQCKESSIDAKSDDLISKPFAQEAFPLSSIRLSKETVKEALSLTSRLSPSRSTPDRTQADTEKPPNRETDGKADVKTVSPEESDQGEDSEKARNIFDLFGGVKTCENIVSEGAQDLKVVDGSGGETDKTSPQAEAEHFSGNEDNVLPLNTDEHSEDLSSNSVENSEVETAMQIDSSATAAENNDVIICGESVSNVKDVIVLSDEEASPNDDIADSSSSTPCLAIQTTDTKPVLPLGSLTDRGGYSSLRASPRCTPRVSTVRKVATPQPIEVLRTAEKEVVDKRCAFVSDQLEEYLQQDKESKLKIFEQEYTEEADIEMMDTETQMAAKAAITKQICASEPDIDCLDGNLFMAFPSEAALNAHNEVERCTDWVDEAYLLKVAQLKYLKEKALMMGVRLVDVKTKLELKQNLRGVHKRYQKYQRLFRRELEITLKAKEKRLPAQLMTKTPEKTSDITKIKGWKEKFSNTEELQQATGLHFTEAGKLHWRTEERILKELNPEDVKDIGLNLKKKRRKLIHFNKRKGLTKTDTKSSPPAEGDDTVSEMTDVTETQEEKVPYCVKYFSQHKYDKRKRFVKKLGLNKEEEFILKKLGSLHVAKREGNAETDKDSKSRKSKASLQITKLTQSMALAAVSALDRKLISKSRAMSKSTEKPITIKEDVIDLAYEGVTEESGVMEPKVEEIEDEEPLSSRVSSRRSSIDNSQSMKTIKTEQIKTETATCNKPGRTFSEDKGFWENNNGCRYGCICHLCKFREGTEDEEEEEAARVPSQRPVCDKEYCKLGCICESIEKPVQEPVEPHCRNPACMFSCQCKKGTEGADTSTNSASVIEEGRSKGKRRRKSLAAGKKNKSLLGNVDACVPAVIEDTQRDQLSKGDDNDDWEPPVKKRKRQSNPNRFANLPRRESTYRLAKNLDAVSRKALMVYESSEMYVEQKTRKRRSDPQAEEEMLEHFLKAKITRPSSHNASHTVSTGPTHTELREPNKETKVLVPQRVIKTEPIYLVDSEEEKDYVKGMSTSSNEIASAESQLAITRPDAGYNSVMSRSQNSHSATDPRETTPNNQTTLKKQDNQSSPDSRMENRQPKSVSEKIGLVRKHIKPEKKTDNIEKDTKWRTQMVCLKAKKKSADAQSKSDCEIKLLEIISNCKWEADRTHMLSKISQIISRGCTGNGEVVTWSNYLLQFLPKASKPAVIPQELKSKLPNSMYSIRIRVTLKQPETPVEETAIVIEVIDNEPDKPQEIKKPKKEKAEKEMVQSVEENNAMRRMTPTERERYINLKHKKKLVEKIRFAEKLKAMLEEQTLPAQTKSKVPVTAEAVDKALRKYKTQLLKAHTGASNVTINNLIHAVQAAKGSESADKQAESVKSSETVTRSDSPQQQLNSSAETPLSNCNTSISSSNSVEAVPGVSTNITSLSKLLDRNGQSSSSSPSDDKTLSPSTIARIEANQGLVVHAHCKKTASKPMQHVSIRSFGGVQESEVLLIPVREDGQDAPNSQVLSAKLSVVSSTNESIVQPTSIPVSSELLDSVQSIQMSVSQTMNVTSQLSIASSTTPQISSSSHSSSSPSNIAPLSGIGTMSAASFISQTSSSPICIANPDGSKVLLSSNQLGSNTPQMVLNAIQPLANTVMFNNVKPVGPGTSISGGQPVILNPVPSPAVSSKSDKVHTPGMKQPASINSTQSPISSTDSSLASGSSMLAPQLSPFPIHSNSAVINPTNVPAQCVLPAAKTSTQVLGPAGGQTPYRILSTFPGGTTGKPIIHLVPVCGPPSTAVSSVPTGPSTSTAPEYIAVPVQFSSAQRLYRKIPVINALQHQTTESESAANTTVTNSVNILSGPKISSMPAASHLSPLNNRSHPVSILPKGPDSIKEESKPSINIKKVSRGKKKLKLWENAGTQSETSVSSASSAKSVASENQSVGITGVTLQSKTSATDVKKLWKVSKPVSESCSNVTTSESDQKKETTDYGQAISSNEHLFQFDGKNSLPSSQQSGASMESTCNVSDLIQNTSAAGREIANTLGALLDDSVEDNVKRDTGSFDLMQENSALMKSVLDDCEHSDDDSILIEDYYDCSSNSSSSDMYVTPVNDSLPGSDKKKGKKGSVVGGGGKKSRSVSPWSSSESSMQSHFTDTIEDYDVGEKLSSSQKLKRKAISQRMDSEAGSSKQHKSSQSLDDLEFRQESLEKDHESNPSMIECSREKRHQKKRMQCERNRRQEVKTLCVQLQAEIYQDDRVDEAFGLDMPKLTILKKTIELVKRLEERMKILETAKEVRTSSQRNLKKRLKELTESFVQSGISEEILNNFLKSVAKAIITRHGDPDGGTMEIPHMALYNNPDGTVSLYPVKPRIGRKPKVDVYIDNAEEGTDQPVGRMSGILLEPVAGSEVENLTQALKHHASTTITEPMAAASTNSAKWDIREAKKSSARSYKSLLPFKKVPKKVEPEVIAMPSLASLLQHGTYPEQDVVVIDDPTLAVQRNKHDVIALDD